MASRPQAFNCDRCKCVNHDAGYQKWSIPGVIETSTCPRWLVTERSWALLRLHGHYSKGHLATAGGITDQPNPYTEAMTIIDGQLRSRENGD